MKSFQSLVRLTISRPEFVRCSLGDPNYGIDECQSRGLSYVVPLKITLQLQFRDKKDYQGPGEIRRSEVYMGEIPLMVEQGTFIINGSERVIFSQLRFSPGISFKTFHVVGFGSNLKFAL